MLNQIPLAYAALPHIGQGKAHYAQLVVTREHLVALYLARLGVFDLHNLRVVFQNVGQPGRGQQFAPQVVGLQTQRVGRVTRAIVVTLVQRQKPRCLASQLRAHTHLAVVHRKVHHAATKLKQLFALIAVALVLLHCVVYRLLGEAVFQLKGGNGQAVDEQAQVQRAARFIQTVGKLPCNDKSVLLVQRQRLGIAL